MGDCYFERHSNCHGGLSREHYISKSVLDLIFDGTNGVVSGTPWAFSDGKKVSKESLTAKILCQRHNNGLAALDAAAKQLFKAIQDSQTNLQTRGKDGSKVNVSGDAFERWLLKVTAGMLASGNFGRGGIALQRHVPDI